MVRLVEGTWLIGVNDAWGYHQCPQAFLNAVDAARGIAELAAPVEQPLRRLMGRVLTEHRERLVNDLSGRTKLIVTIDPPVRDVSGPEYLLDHWFARLDATTTAISEGYEVIVSPSFAVDHSTTSSLRIVWVWSVDLLVKSPLFAPDIDQHERGFEVWEGKLGSSTMGKTLLRLAATKDFADHAGISTTNRVRVVFANGPDTLRGVHRVVEQWSAIRTNLAGDLEAHLESNQPVSWATRRFAACGKKTCGWCVQALRHHDDLFRLPGISRGERRSLQNAGFATLTDFARTSIREADDRVTSIERPELTRLHHQAALLTLARNDSTAPPPFEVINQAVLDSLPHPSDGDLFIDFEADPTFRQWSATDPYFPAPAADNPRWWLGLDYLLGVATHDTTDDGGHFRPLWSSDFSEEKHHFLELIGLIRKTLAADPSAHVYHYAPYERVALRRMATRYRVGAEELGRWIGSGVFVDLYRTVTKGLVAGISNYSLKSVEKLFLSPGQRKGIGTGAASVESVWQYWEAVAIGNESAAQNLRDDITSYNLQDTLSTRELLAWLHSLQTPQRDR